MFCLFIYILDGHLFFFLNWNIIAFPCCVRFCCYKEVNQPRAHTGPLPLGRPTRLGHHRAGPVMYSRFPRAIYSAHGS